VIGGGLTGVNTAMELAERGLSVICWKPGASAGRQRRNGGQLICGIGHDVSALPARRPGRRALPAAGRHRLGGLVSASAHAIDCDLRWGFCELANTPAQFAPSRTSRKPGQLGYRHETRLVAPS
jgi:glycine/D-amino acid oxidase-like deaminating enzyme